MNKNPILVAATAAILSLASIPSAPAAETNFFPPADEAKSVDNFDANGFIIDGQRTFIASGSIHFPRVPRDLWKDRLLRLKRAGFNTVQTYVFWNYHEQTEDSFDFAGEKDLGAFLQTAQDLGLYATVRVGPYVCAEWNFGGYPLWLKFKPGMNIRSNDPTYVKYQQSWLSHVLPIVAAHQINHGGNVIFVQLENEGGFWGAWTPDHPNTDPYWQRLYKDAKENGIEVPFFMSGMHHGFQPVPEDTNSADRVNPWYSTETWSGWYDIYGMRRDVYYQILNFMTKTMARGANGFNYYMLHGGTNFDYWNNNEDASTYDYGTAIGQAGDFRPMYYQMKKYNTFATSFADILENATGDMDEYKDFVTNGYVMGVRKSPDGTIVFVQGSASQKVPVTLKGVGDGTGGTIDLEKLEVAGIVLDAPLIPAPADVRIAEAATPILGVAHHGKTTTLVVYGKAGGAGVLTLKEAGVKKDFTITYPDSTPSETLERVGDQTLRILALSSDLVRDTWIVGPKDRQSVVVGPEFVGDFDEADGKPAMTIERFYGHDAPSQVLVYGDAASGAAHLAVEADKTVDSVPAPELADWQISAAPPEVQPTFDDSAWMQSDDPTQMGADGDNTAYAWYRAVVQAPSAGSGTIHFAGAADHIFVYVNGKRCDATPSDPHPKYSDSDELRNGSLTWDAKSDFQAGANSLAVFVSHQGRDKAVAYSGPVLNYYPKGLFRPVTVDLGGQTIPIRGWKLHGGIPAPAGLTYRPLDANYAPATPQFFQTTFTAKPPGQTGPNPMYRFLPAGLSRGSLFLNGHNLGRYPDTVLRDGKPLPLYLPECWLDPSGKNTLAVFDEEGNAPTQAHLEVEMASSRERIAVSQPADPTAAFTFPTVPEMAPGGAASVDDETDKPATASSAAPDNPAYYVNDGQEDTYWYPAAVPTADHPEWIQIDLGESKAFKSFEIGWSCRVNHVSYHLEGSDDGSSWTQLADEPATSEDKKDVWKTVPVPDGTKARYIRVTITGVKDESKVGINTVRTHS
jgi:beta-galactosidase